MSERVAALQLQWGTLCPGSTLPSPRSGIGEGLAGDYRKRMTTKAEAIEDSLLLLKELEAQLNMVRSNPLSPRQNAIFLAGRMATVKRQLHDLLGTDEEHRLAHPRGNSLPMMPGALLPR